MRSQYVPIIPIKLLKGTTLNIRDLSSARYLDILDQLEFDYTYLLEECFIGYPDLLSNKLYNSMDYWDIIFMYNGIMDWYDGMTAGMVIHVPTLTSIERALTSVTPSRVNQFVTI